MSHAEAALPRPRLDAKRIVATSGAIAVHVAVLMMLMMPPEVSLPDEKVVITDVFIDEPKKEIIQPKPIEKVKPLPVVQHVTTPVRQIIEQVVPVDDTPRIADTLAQDDDQPPAKDFSVASEVSPFQQLTTDVAPVPPYPRMALSRGIQGTVMLRVHVDASGAPIEVSIESSSGSTLLDEAAMKFVKSRWHFVPAMSGGAPIDAWALVPVEYVLQ